MSDSKNDPDQTYDYKAKYFYLLSDEEYQSFVHARDTLLAFKSEFQLHRIIQWNYQEYCSTLKIYLDAYLRNDDEFLRDFPVHPGVNRCFLNVLSSIRTFLDYMETSLSRRYGKTSENFMKFKYYCSNVYDESFSYRFLYKLRNYSQHCGLPIDNIVFNTNINPQNPKHLLSALEVSITRDRLLENFEWKKLKEEMYQQPPLIEINNHVGMVIRQVENINSKPKFRTLKTK